MIDKSIFCINMFILVLTHIKILGLFIIGSGSDLVLFTVTILLIVTVNAVFRLNIIQSIIIMVIIRVISIVTRWILSIVSDTYRCVLFLITSLLVSLIGCYSIYCNNLLLVAVLLLIIYTKLIYPQNTYCCWWGYPYLYMGSQHSNNRIIYSSKSNYSFDFYW